MTKQLTDPTLAPRLAAIKLLIFDVDGVLTDGLAYYDSQGMAMKAFSMRDGFGFVLARFAGIELAALTGNVAEMVVRRLEKFHITRIKGGHFRKLPFYEELLAETGIAEQYTAYIGDDLFDLPVLRRAGVSVAPADADSGVLAEVEAVTHTTGGRGCVRELVEAIIKARGKDAWEQVLHDIEHDPAGGR